MSSPLVAGRFHRHDKYVTQDQFEILSSQVDYILDNCCQSAPDPGAEDFNPFNSESLGFYIDSITQGSFELSQDGDGYLRVICLSGQEDDRLTLTKDIYLDINSLKVQRFRFAVIATNSPNPTNAAAITGSVTSALGTNLCASSGTLTPSLSRNVSMSYGVAVNIKFNITLRNTGADQEVLIDYADIYKTQS